VHAIPVALIAGTGYSFSGFLDLALLVALPAIAAMVLLKVFGLL